MGAGNVLGDLIDSGVLPCFRLTTIFRQARESAIIAAAHQINRGETPQLESPFKTPEVWKQSDCFFIDSAETAPSSSCTSLAGSGSALPASATATLFGQMPYQPDLPEEGVRPTSSAFPKEFAHVSLGTLAMADSAADELLALARRTHPWSSLYYGLTALDVVRKLYSEWAPKYYPAAEIQVLTPMIRGSLGAANLNKVLQRDRQSAVAGQTGLTLGERVFRPGRPGHPPPQQLRAECVQRRHRPDSGHGQHQPRLRSGLLPDGRPVEYNRDQITELDQPMPSPCTRPRARNSTWSSCRCW